LLRVVRIFLSVAMLSALLSSCRPSVHRQTGFAMSTTLSLLVSSTREPDWPQLFDFAERSAWRFDHRRADGAVGALNRAGQGGVEPEVLRILETAQAVAASSGGAFDPSILPLTELWSFDSGGRVPAESEIVEARRRVGYANITIDEQGRVSLPEGYGLDLGGIAKGAVVDLLADHLREREYEDFLIDAGGDILVSGLKQGAAWRIAIRHPRDSQGVVGVLSLGGKDGRVAVVTSGDYERFFEQEGRRYHHILDPRSGYPADRLVSVTVIAPTCALADALSTAVFVLGPERGLELLAGFENTEGLLIAEGEGRLDAYRSDGFPLELENLDLN